MIEVDHPESTLEFLLDRLFLVDDLSEQRFAAMRHEEQGASSIDRVWTTMQEVQLAEPIDHPCQGRGCEYSLFSDLGHRVPSSIHELE
ncbi:MAG: hypothetical protein ABT15_17580 [Pseudonocardia sp. SCN 73-27]|nr:MAG: hypothetical protein ABS80_04995 [Pseudonocardia sp. SCN 72-51]ODV05312.1 MAG: hypothetical protein ABT15_17580 [Pseudonocardia sp. SCN 73-27]